MQLLLKNAGWLYTCDDGDRLLRDGWICVENGAIVALGQGEPPWQGADEVIDAKGALVVPGLINLHHHFFQSLTRAVPISQRALSLDWMYWHYPLWAQFAPGDVGLATAISAVELIASGATTSVDHSNLHLTDTLESIEEQVNAAAEAGLRLHLVRGSLATMEAGVENRLRPLMGQEAIDHLLGRDHALIPLIERTLKKFQNRSNGTMLDMSVGPGGITYGDEALMRDHVRLSATYDCGLHTHYHPRPVEREMSLSMTGRAPIDYLDSTGWLTDRSWFAHCTELDDAEIARFSARGTAVSHSPRTAMRLGYEIPRISAMRRAGVAVGIGVDGASSNDGGSMLGDMRVGLLLHRCGADRDTPEDWLTPYDMLLMATRSAAMILRRTDIGQLTPGARADFAVFDLSDPSYAGAPGDPLGAWLMSGADTRARDVVVDGKPRLRNGKYLGPDPLLLTEKGNAAAARILANAKQATGVDFAAYPGAARQPMEFRA